MEYEESLKFLEEQCTCCICLGRFQDPASLPCSHSCCRSCFEKIVKLGANGAQSSIDCPICRKVYFLKGKSTLLSLQGNRDLKEKLNILAAIVPPETQLKPVEKCQVCVTFPKRGADLRCLSCDVFICSTCLQEKNLNDYTHASHHLAGLKRNETGSNTLLCKDHKFQFRYFCRTCDMLVCTECCLMEHRSHDRVPTNYAKSVVKKQFDAIYNTTKQKSALTEGAVLRCKESIQKFSSEGVKLRNNIKTEKRKILSQVLFTLNKVEEEFMGIYEGQVDYFKRVLGGHLEEAQKKHSTVASWKDSLDEMMNMQDDVEFLAKSEHAKRHFDVSKVNSVDIDDKARGIHDLDYSTELLETGLASSVLDQMTQSLGKLLIKGSKDKSKWRTYGSQISGNIIAEAGREDGSNLSKQLKELDLLKPPESAGASLRAQTHQPVAATASGASCPPSSTVPNCSFSAAVQGNSQRNTTVVHSGLVIVQPTTQTTQPSSTSGNRNQGTQSNSISASCSNISTLQSNRPAVHVTQVNRNATGSVQNGQGLSASAVDVRAPQNNQNSGNQNTASGSQQRGRGRGQGRGRGRGRGYSQAAVRVHVLPDYDDSSSESESESSTQSYLNYCHRCLRNNHNYKDCYADRNVNGEWIRGVFQNKCFRCGRYNHLVPECYATFDVDGDRI